MSTQHFKRKEFTPKTKAAALARAGGFCECGCGEPLSHPVEYDHIVEAFFGGGNDLDNCAVLNRACHLEKTKERMKAVSKTRRLEKKRLGIEKKKAKLPGSKATKWRKKLNGQVEKRR